MALSVLVAGTLADIASAAPGHATNSVAQAGTGPAPTESVPPSSGRATAELASAAALAVSDQASGVTSDAATPAAPLSPAAAGWDRTFVVTNGSTIRLVATPTEPPGLFGSSAVFPAVSSQWLIANQPTTDGTVFWSQQCRDTTTGEILQSGGSSTYWLDARPGQADRFPLLTDARAARGCNYPGVDARYQFDHLEWQFGNTVAPDGSNVARWFPIGHPRRPAEYGGAFGPQFWAGGGNPAMANAQCQCVADPVNTATGELWETVADLDLPGRAPVTAERTYSSYRAAAPGMFGAGWASPWEARVTDGATTTVTQENGSVVAFAKDDQGRYTAPASVHATLERDASTGVYTFTRRNEMVMGFDPDGRLTSITDRNGERTTLTWSATQLVVTAADGRALTIARDGNGRAQSLTGPGNRSVTYRYDPTGRLSQVTDARGKIWTYEYETAAPGRMTAMVTPTGARTTSRYDGAGRVVAQIGPRGGEHFFDYTVSGNSLTTRVTDATGVVTDYRYDYDRLTSRTLDPLGTPAMWSFTYDQAGNQTSSTDPTGVRTTATFDVGGNPMTRTDAAGNTTTATYNLFDQPLTIKDAAGHTSTFTYDSRGNLLTSSVPQSATVTAVTRFTRDSTHPADVLSVTDPDGRVTSMTYTPTGFVASRTAGDGGRSTFTYDPYGAVLTSVTPKGNLVGAIAASYTTTRTYDAGGLLLTVAGPAGRSAAFGYDDVGRLTTSTDANQKVTSTSYHLDGTVRSSTDPMLRTSTFTYDLARRPLTTTGPDGALTVTTYDSHGRTATVVNPTGNVAGIGAAEKAARTTTFSYDLAGRPAGSSRPDPTAAGTFLTETVTYDSAGRPWRSTAPGNLTTTTTYDALNRVETVTDPTGKTTRFGYDWAGHRTSSTDPLGHTSTLAYTPAGLLAASADALANTTKHTYDAVGRLKTTIDPRGTCGTCTPANYTSSLSYDLNGNQTSSSNQLFYGSRFGYDAADRPITRTDPKNRVSTYGYDGNDRILAVRAPDGGTTTYSYNHAGDLAGTTGPRGNTTSYGYDPAGRLNASTDPLGRKRTRTYTLDGQPAADITARGNASPTPATGTITHTYDAAGRPTGVDYGDATPDVAFAYDNASRRSSVTDAAGIQTYGYDNNGRTTRIARGTAAWTYAYNDDGTLRTSTRPDGTAETHTYDAADRPKTTTTPAGTTTYGWDPAGHLLTSALPNATTETQTWDRAGNLAKIETKNGATVRVSQTVTRDATNNPTQIVVARGTGTETRSFRYDFNDRLQGVCYTTIASCTGASTATQWWTYDLDGNRTTEKNGTGTGTTTTYAYDNANQLTSRKVGTAAAVIPTYDADGNTLTDGTSTFNYDLNNRSTRTLLSNVTATTWQRDGDGNPLKKTTGTTTTSYGWDLLGAVPRLGSTTAAATGTTTSTYRYDPLGRASTLTTGTTHQSFAHDTLGAPTDHLTTAGVITRSNDWTPFGTTRTATGAPTPTGPTSSIGYAGMLQTGHLGTYLTRDRTYTPTDGRWTGTDPLTQGIGTPFDSPYTYVTNRPGVFVDPLGQSGCLWWLWQCGGAMDDLGHATLGVSDGLAQAGQGIVSGLTHPEEVVAATRAAYQQDGLWYAVNQFNPVYHMIENYTQMWTLGTTGCVREAAAAGTSGTIDAVSTAALAAGGASALRAGTAPAAISAANSGLRAPQVLRVGDVKLSAVPKGAVGTPAQTGKGMEYVIPRGTPEISDRVASVRIMDPVTSGKYQYPNGYAVYMNGLGQTINPLTGQTIANSNLFAHIPLP